MSGSRVTIKAFDGGTFSAYVASPAAAKAPGVVVIQEIFGVNQVMRDLADGLAAQGYLAVCPDLFWRQKPDVDITDRTEAEWQQAFGHFQGFDVDRGMADLTSTLSWLRGQDGCTGKAGSVGYCLGGKLAYLMATRTDCDASVGYYGVGIEGALDETKKIVKPLLLHIAAQDEYCPPAAQAQITSALAGHKLVQTHVYAGVGHAFARAGGAHYDAAAASAANDRTAAFFKQHLG